MNRLSGPRDEIVDWAQRFEAVTQVSLQAQLVHRDLRPLWANSAFVDLFHFASIADVLACGSLLGLFDPDTDYTRRAYGRRLLCRRSGARFPAEIFSRPVVWDGAEAAALAIRDATEEELALPPGEAGAMGRWVRAAPTLQRPKGPRREPRSVLVVHPWPEARRALAAELIALGLTPEPVAAPEQALAAFEMRPFDVVILATGLALDGLALARRIRALPWPWARVPIVALVGAEDAEIRKAIAEAGMDAWLVAPPSRARLAEAIRALTGAIKTGGSVQPAELDQVEQEDDREEPSDRIDGHHVRAPNSTGPETLEPELLGS